MICFVCFLLVNSPVSEFYMPTFQNTMSVPSSKAGSYEEFFHTDLPMKMEQTVFWNIGIYNSDAGELPRRKHTTFKTQQKFEINNDLFCFTYSHFTNI